MMRATVRGVASAALLAALGALAGCASEKVLTRQDPAFSADALRGGGLAVLGAVQVDEVAQSRPPLIDALQRVLAGSRKDVRLVPASQVHAAMGDSAVRLFLLGYQLRGDPDEVWLARAADAARPLARYGVLARVQSLRVRYGTRDVDPSPTETSGRSHEVRATGRDVRAELTVYDLSTRAIVYRGAFLGSFEALPNFRPPPADTLSPDSLQLTKRPTWTSGPSQSWRPRTEGFPTPGPSDSPTDMGYPEAPPVAQAAQSAFLEFARALPGGSQTEPLEAAKK